ncbi:hypothetical protein FOA52_013308 [Chlamydomonas sp. UWO 241]|nr:hypothetical protein FOA52_013308 [Chlamydomonas sp. UWO 241]
MGLLDALDHNSEDEHEREHKPMNFNGLKVVFFASNTPVCRQAMPLVKGVLGKQGVCTEFVLAHCASNPYAFEGMIGQLEQIALGLPGYNTRCELWQKPEDCTLIDSMMEFIDREAPDLVVIASKSLSGTDVRPTALKNVVLPALPAKNAIASQSFAYKLAQALRKYPILMFKSNTKGSFLSYVDQTQAPMKYMVDLQPNSRFMLGWLLDVLDSQKDQLFMAIGRAFEPNGVTKQVALRMSTMFMVQASNSNKMKMKPVTRMLKTESEKALPGQVMEDGIDIVLIQAPRCRDLSPYVTQLLTTCPASILIYPPDTNDTALGSHGSVSRAPPSGSGAAAGADMPAARSSGRYSYSSGGPPQVDDAAQAALDAMQARQAARQRTSDAQAASFSSTQRMKY